MPNSLVDIEWIVREVVRRLGDVQNQTTVEANERPAAVPGELLFPERLITLKTLEGQLGGVTRLVFPAKAIVTPAVVDELREKGVVWSRGKGTANGQTARDSERQVRIQHDIVLGVAVGNFHVDELTNLLKPMQVGVVDNPGRSLTDVLEKVVAHVRSGNIGVLLTAAPAAATVLANRHAGVRAAVGSGYPAVRRAVEEIGANLLVLDPFGRGMNELAGLFGEFARDGVRECPREYRKAL